MLWFIFTLLLALLVVTVSIAFASQMFWMPVIQAWRVKIARAAKDCFLVVKRQSYLTKRKMILLTTKTQQQITDYFMVFKVGWTVAVSK